MTLVLAPLVQGLSPSLRAAAGDGDGRGGAADAARPYRAAGHSAGARTTARSRVARQAMREYEPIVGQRQRRPRLVPTAA